MPRILYSTTRSPYARKVRIMLAEKALPFEVVTVDLSARTPSFLAASPLGKVPALVDEDGTVVFDSTVMAEYLEDRYPDPPFMGKTWSERLVHRALDELADTVADCAVATYQARARDDAPAEDRAMALAKKALTELSRRAEHGPWPAAFGLGDAALISALGYFELRVGRAPLEAYPAVLRRAADHAARPIVAATVPVP